MDAHRHEARDGHLHRRERERLAAGDVRDSGGRRCQHDLRGVLLRTAGRYSVNENYFTSATTRGPLTALQNGTDGANGVYRYGASGFPTTGYRSSNYWVDVVFTTS